jgi:hypothetical protein
MDDSGASCLSGSSTCGGSVDSPLVDNGSLLTSGAFASDGVFLTNLPFLDDSTLANLTNLDDATFQDQQLQALAPGILQGAGSIGDPSTYAIWVGASAVLGAVGSAGALYELGTEAWTNFGANMAMWQTGGLAGSTDAGFAEALDIISNAGPAPFSISGTGAGAWMGASLGVIINTAIDPPSYAPPWKGVPYPYPSSGPR